MNIIDTLELKLPLFQAPLACYPNTSGLVAKISECGGLGVYSTDFQSINDISTALNDIKLRTDKAFAVTIDTKTSDDCIDLADKSSANIYLKAAYQALNISATEAEPLPDFAEILACVIPHKPAAIIFQNGLPDERIIQDTKRNGILTFAIASNLLEAIAINNSRIDAIILQGSESAGTQSQFSNDLSIPYYPVNTLLHHAIASISKPLIVWGDYQSSSNIVAALVNGASAVMIDTPFWTTQESPIPDSYRQRLMEHTEMTIITSDVWQGYPAHVLKNALTQNMQKASRTALSAKKQQRLMQPVIHAAIAQDNADYMPLWAGLCATVSGKTVSELCAKFHAELSNIIE